jgi:CubicO group peptidase (beta-lactamase class C family)
MRTKALFTAVLVFAWLSFPLEAQTAARVAKRRTLYSWPPGQGFGLAFSTTDRVGADGLASIGSWGWDGAYGTTYKVDPKERLVIAFMVQQFPYGVEAQSRFPTLVYQALVEPKK